MDCILNSIFPISRLYSMRLTVLVLFVSVSASAQNIAYVTDKKTISTSVAGSDTVFGFRHLVDTGNWVVYYDSTQRQVAFTYNFLGNNRSDYKSYYGNGHPKQIRLNNDSVPYYRQDQYAWYPNGQKHYEVYSTRDTNFTYDWWRNGQLSSVKKIWGGSPWKHDIGEQTEYHPTGVLYRNTTYAVDSTIIRYIHPNGQLGTIAIYKPDTSGSFGSRCFYMHSFHDNGKESSTELRPNLGRQPITYFYSSGIKKAQCDWMEGNIGPYKEWHENGKLKSEGLYIMGIKKFTNLKSVNYYPTKSGHWIYYNEAGWKEKEEWREIDGTVTFKEYNEKGEVVKDGEIQEEIPAGVVFPDAYQH